MSTPDFFRSRLDAMVDPRHPLAVLAGRLDWEQIESRIAPLFARNGQRQAVEGVDLFGPTPTTVGVHPGGRPRLPFRLMVSLLYLKHAYGESDESVCERWSENVGVAVLQWDGLLHAEAAVRCNANRSVPAGAG